MCSSKSSESKYTLSFVLNFVVHDLFPFVLWQRLDYLFVPFLALENLLTFFSNFSSIVFLFLRNLRVTYMSLQVVSLLSNLT